MPNSILTDRPVIILVDGVPMYLEYFIGSARHKIMLEEIADAEALQRKVDAFKEDIVLFNKHRKTHRNATFNSD